MRLIETVHKHKNPYYKFVIFDPKAVGEAVGGQALAPV